MAKLLEGINPSIITQPNDTTSTASKSEQLNKQRHRQRLGSSVEP